MVLINIDLLFLRDVVFELIVFPPILNQLPISRESDLLFISITFLGPMIKRISVC